MTEDAKSDDLSNIRNRGNLPDMFILEPDIGLGDHVKANRRSNENARREESSISFRRFLQNDGHSGRSAHHPDLYTCARQDRSNEGAAVDPESPDLPDFVQDHLAVEQMYFNDGASASSGNLPDFASFMSRSEAENHVADGEHRRDRNRVPLDLPVPVFACNNSSNDRSRAGLRLPFDLTTDSSENNIASNGSRLPDFLSDGHILGPDASQNMPNRPASSHNDHSSVPFDLEERTSRSMLERDNERLRQEVHFLRSALMKKDDRIKELENIVMALEISKVQMQTDANTQTVAKNNEHEGAASSKHEIDQPKKCEISTEISRNANLTDDKGTNPTLAIKVRMMTNVSERLVRELLKIITDFQVNIDETYSSPESVPSAQAADDGEKSADNNCSSSTSKNSLHPE